MACKLKVVVHFLQKKTWAMLLVFLSSFQATKITSKFRQVLSKTKNWPTIVTYDIVSTLSPSISLVQFSWIYDREKLFWKEIHVSCITS